MPEGEVGLDEYGFVAGGAGRGFSGGDKSGDQGGEDCVAGGVEGVGVIGEGVAN